MITIGSEVFGSYVGGIDVSAELKNGDGWLRCGWKDMRLFWGGEVAQDCQWRRDGARYWRLIECFGFH